MGFAVIKMPSKKKAACQAGELLVLEQSATDLGRRAGLGANMVLAAIGKVSELYKQATTHRARTKLFSDFRSGLSEQVSIDQVSTST